MSCKCRELVVKLVEHAYNTIVSTKKYGAKIIKSWFNVNASTNKYDVSVDTNKYGVSFCISYRPVGFSERILARGRRNDRGIRTPDGIFNDGKI